MSIWSPGTRYRPGSFLVSVAASQGYGIQSIGANYEVVLPDGRSIPLSKILQPDDIAEIEGLIAQAGAVINQKIMVETEGLSELWIPTAYPKEHALVVDEATVLSIPGEGGIVTDSATVSGV